MKVKLFTSHRSTIGVFSLVLIFGASLISACAPKTAVEPITEAIETQTDLSPDPALVTGTLENGLRYAVLQNKTPVGTGALRVQFQTGSLNELPGTEGLAHYLEHMAFNGSKNVPEGEMIKILERLGLSFGADTNASTGLDRTVYKLNLPSISTEVLDAAFMLMKETAQHLTLDQDAIERELGIILSEKRTRDSASYRAWEKRMRFLTNGSDLMDRLPIGTDESLRAINAEDFKAYYSAHYHPEKTIVAFVGDAEPELIIQYIKETFADWNPKSEAQEDRPASPANTTSGKIEFYAEEGLPTSISIMSLRAYEKRLDTTATRKQRVIERLATGMMSYRMRELSEKADRPFINASMARMSNFELTEGISFTAYTQAENWEKALVGLNTELRRVLEYGFTQQELDAQLARVQSAYEAIAEGADTRPTTARRGGLINQLMSSFDNDTVFTHPQQNLALFNQFKDDISLRQVNESLRQLWGDIKNSNIFMTSAKPIENPETAIASVIAQSNHIAIEPPNNNALASEFAYTHFGAPGEVVSDIYDETLDAHFIKFDNNVRLNFKNTDYDKDRVLVHVKFGDGNLSSPRKSEGLRRMAYGVVAESGLEAHKLSEIRRLMAGKLVVPSGFNFRDGGDTFFMTATTVPDNFRDQLNIFTATLTNTAFSPDIRSNHISKLRAWYPRHDTTIGGVVSKTVPRIIRNGDKRFGFDNEEDFYSPTMSEIKAWLLPQFKNGLVEITIVGDINKETVLKHIASTFGAIPKRNDKKGEYPDMRAITFPAGKAEPYKVYHRGDNNQAQLRIYWPASDGFNPSYTRQLQVLRAILRNRLVKEIREGEATTYSPQAASHASKIFPNYGYIAAILTLKPDDLDSMASLVKTIATNIAQQGISEDEFLRAITPMIERLDSQDKRNPYWASVLADAQTDKLGIDAHLTRESDLKEMQLIDVQSLATDILNTEDSIEIRILPKTQ